VTRTGGGGLPFGIQLSRLGPIDGATPRRLTRPVRRKQEVPETQTPSAIVSAYFARMRARDPSVADLFHENAELIGLGTRRRGRSSIREFYSGVIERAGPSPRTLGSFLADGDRVAAEILVELSGGATIHAVDLFTIEEGLIRSLTYFIANE
jgi:hypothetical protein